MRDRVRRDRSLGGNRSSLGQRVRAFLTRLVLFGLTGTVAAVAGVFLWAGFRPPSAALVEPVELVGRATPVALELRAGRSGLRSWQLTIEARGVRYVLAEDELPRTWLLGGSQRDAEIRLTVDAGKAGMPEGGAELVVHAQDHSPLSFLRRPAPVLSVPVTIDLTPPLLTVLGGQHYLTLGGSELVLYTTDADAVRSGVEVGKYFFPGETGLFADPAARAALFAVPQDLDARVVPKVVAVDRAGNRREAPFPCTIREKRFPETEIKVTDDFLQRKIPQILADNGLTSPAEPVQGYLLVNRELRKSSESRIQEIIAGSSPKPLFDGAFRQQPNSLVASRFAEQRTYRYNGEVIDRQTHLGYDLASLKQAPVEAANAGEVRFVGNLGIYGNVVILDHGLGIASLYAHLSSASVTVGQSVSKGETVGRTGETGLAGGDHLHFSIMLRGVHIDPVEWWDPKWVRNHVAAQLASLPSSGANSSAAVAAQQP